MDDQRRIEEAERMHERNYQFLEAKEESVNANAQFALKSLFIVNGGALIAILTFIANLLSNEKLFAAAPSVVAPMIWFSVGLACATAATVLAYLTNYAYMQNAYGLEHTWEHPYVADTRASRNWERVGLAAHVLAVIATFASLAAFAWGMLETRDALQSLPF